MATEKYEPIISDTVIYSIATAEYVPFVLNLRESMRRVGLGNHLRVYTPNRNVQQTLLAAGVDSLRFGDQNLADWADFASGLERSRIVAYKYAVATEILTSGNNALFIDGDIVFLRNPIQHLCEIIDKVSAQMIMQFESPKNVYNTGFWFARPHSCVLELFKAIQDSLLVNKTFNSDQSCFNKITRSRDRVAIHALDVELFACGNQFLGKDSDDPEWIDRSANPFPFNSAYLLHFNYLVGKESKINAMKRHNAVFYPGLETELAKQALRCANSGVIRGTSVQDSNTELIARLQQLEESLTEKDAQLNLITARCGEAERRLEAIESATFWRASYPLRRMTTKWPPGLRRAVRSAAKLAWWSLTLRLPDRLRQRRALSRPHAAKTGGRRRSFFRSVLIKANKFAIDRLPDYVVDRFVVWLPDYVVDSLSDCVIDGLPDYAAVNVQHFRLFRKFPNLKSPETFNEKIAWRKLYQRNPKFTIFSDKIAAKAEVAKIIGEQHIVETLWVGDTPEDIPFDKLEPPYVIKVNHSAGCNEFVRTKHDLNKERIVQSMREQLHYNHGHKFREWGYLDIPRRVLVERMIKTPGGDPPEDYKFYVYRGRVHLIEVHVDRFKSQAMNTYDREWRLFPLDSGYPNIPRPFAKPLNLEQMIEIAEKIGGQFDFARVDLYSTPQGILFGEVTFYPGAGLEIYSDEFGKPWRIHPSVPNGKRLFDPTALRPRLSPART